MIKSMGEALPSALHGESNLLETMLQGNLINEYYSHSVGMSSYLAELGRYVGQLSHRFPRMNIIELGKFPIHIVTYTLLSSVY